MARCVCVYVCVYVPTTCAPRAVTQGTAFVGQTVKKAKMRDRNKRKSPSPIGCDKRDLCNHFSQCARSPVPSTLSHTLSRLWLCSRLIGIGFCRLCGCCSVCASVFFFFACSGIVIACVFDGRVRGRVIEMCVCNGHCPDCQLPRGCWVWWAPNRKKSVRRICAPAGQFDGQRGCWEMKRKIDGDVNEVYKKKNSSKIAPTKVKPKLPDERRK